MTGKSGRSIWVHETDEQKLNSHLVNSIGGVTKGDVLVILDCEALVNVSFAAIVALTLNSDD